MVLSRNSIEGEYFLGAKLPKSISKYALALFINRIRQFNQPDLNICKSYICGSFARSSIQTTNPEVEKCSVE